MARKALFLLAASCLSGFCAAHEFWIEPEAYRVEAGSVLRIGLRVGEPFAGEAVLRDDARIEEFACLGPAGGQPVVGRSGAATNFSRLEAPGLYILAYRSRRTAHEMEAGRFEAYLREEGLQSIIAQRAERGESDRPGREVYSRCAKALVRAGAASPGGCDRRIGLPLEIVPLADPFRAKLGAPLPLVILLRGSPLPGAQVVFACRERPGWRPAAVSNDRGEVGLPVDGPGTFLVTTVQMARAPRESGADWESLWASLTFEIPGEGALDPGSSP